MHGAVPRAHGHEAGCVLDSGFKVRSARGRAVMLKFLAAVFALPTVVLVLGQTLAAFGRVLAGYRAGGPFLAGLAVYCAGHYLLYRPERVYVFTHELTHAVAAWSCGFKVKKMKVGKKGGSVSLDRSNAFVALAPYCLPLFAAALAVGYAAAGLFYPLGQYAGYFMAGLGFFLAFHVVNTVEVLVGTGQSDLQAAGGTVFSAAIITLANCAVLLAAFKFLFPETVSVRDGTLYVAQGTMAFWGWAFNGAADMLGGIYANFK